ncbi:protein of unknown function DUF814 [Desulfovibrio sp. X2]|uniref:NFACT RNA binding domain-containing protein n=1 Tax=Desulfovibrio sp. X2 TaxID=941449 RepID=UPI000358EDB1|nr:NFACT RNA binding domain-containing protein [Desulfovibrio sp. X2]EPR42756.1 protein of unknown function DUF814 [Desulfovibrio sp. X2]
MDAPFFRALAAALCPRLTGGRLGKIFEPAPGCLVFACKSGRDAAFLLFRPARSDNLLCLSPAKPPMPHDPGSRAMWLRKRVSDSRVLRCIADWPNLRLGLDLGTRGFLVLDLRQGPRLLDAAPSDFGREPPWPPLERVLEDDEVWRDFPHLSPAIRRRLRGLPRERAALLLERLAGGEAEGFWLERGRDGVAEPVLWPPSRGKGTEEGGDGRTAPDFDDPLQAAREAYEPRFYALLTTDTAEVARALKSARKRHSRLRGLLERDEERLAGLVARRREAEALQANIHLFQGRELPASAELDHPDGGRVRVALDPRLSASANMERLFAQAAKGRRGLEHVARRRAALEEELAAELAAAVAPEPAGAEAPGAPDAADASDAPDATGRGQARPPSRTLPKRWARLAVKVFCTSDGFLAARGKSAKANHALLTEAASPHDLWLHAKDVPGAHVVLRRDHPGQEVPEQSLEEAAALAALSSGLKDAAWADVLCAEARHVRTIKGAAHGLVRLEKPLRVLRVRPDPALEERLLLG